MKYWPPTDNRALNPTFLCLGKTEFFDQNSRNASMIQSLLCAVLKWLLYHAVDFSVSYFQKEHDLQSLEYFTGEQNKPMICLVLVSLHIYFVVVWVFEVA